MIHLLKFNVLGNLHLCTFIVTYMYICDFLRITKRRDPSKSQGFRKIGADEKTRKARYKVTIYQAVALGWVCVCLT